MASDLAQPLNHWCLDSESGNQEVEVVQNEGMAELNLDLIMVSRFSGSRNVQRCNRGFRDFY